MPLSLEIAGHLRLYATKPASTTTAVAGSISNRGSRRLRQKAHTRAATINTVVARATGSSFSSTTFRQGPIGKQSVAHSHFHKPIQNECRPAQNPGPSVVKYPAGGPQSSGPAQGHTLKGPMLLGTGLPKSSRLRPWEGPPSPA